MWWPGGNTWMPLEETSTDMPENLLPFNQTCLLWKSKRQAARSVPLHQTCQLKLWNFSRQDYCYVVNARYMPAGPWKTPLLCRCSCNKYVFWHSVTSTNTTAVQTCLLVEWCARWVLTGSLPLNQYACRSFTTQSVCLPIFYHSILHACWCCVSLFAIPAYMVSHYKPCLLVWCLTIGHVCWSVATATDILTSWVQIEGWLQIWCYLYRGVITSDMFIELGPKLQCFLKVKDDLSEVLIFQNVTLIV